MPAYKTSKVGSDVSQGQVKKMLKGAGATRIMTLDDEDEHGRPLSMVEFIHAGYVIRLTARHRVLDQREAQRRIRFNHKTVDETLGLFAEQEDIRIWRVLHYQIKTRLEAIEEGLETFEQSFLPHIVDPATDATIWEHVEPAIAGGSLKTDGIGLQAGVRVFQLAGAVAVRELGSGR